MRPRIAILSGSGGWHVQDLLRAGGRVDVDLIAAQWRDVSAGIGGPDRPAVTAADVALSALDGLLLRTMPSGSLEQIVFRMDAIHRAARAGTVVLNPPRAVEIAVDKYLALCRLADAGLPVPPTAACQRLDAALQAFDALGSDVVVKPLFGSESFGMMRLQDRDLAARTFAVLERLGSVIYLQRFIDHGPTDIRLFVVGARLLAAMRRRNDNDWRSNIARGGRGEAMIADDALARLATAAAHACETLIAGVDVLIDRSGKPWVVEVNAVPGWRELTEVSGIDIAAEVLQFHRGCIEQARSSTSSGKA